MAVGKVRIVHDLAHPAEFRPGEVLVADTTTPDWEPADFFIERLAEGVGTAAAITSASSRTKKVRKLA